MDFSVVYMAGGIVASSNDAANKLPFIFFICYAIFRSIYSNEWEFTNGHRLHSVGCNIQYAKAQTCKVNLMRRARASISCLFSVWLRPCCTSMKHCKQEYMNKNIISWYQQTQRGVRRVTFCSQTNKMTSKEEKSVFVPGHIKKFAKTNRQ